MRIPVLGQPAIYVDVLSEHVTKRRHVVARVFEKVSGNLIELGGYCCRGDLVLRIEHPSDDVWVKQEVLESTAAPDVEIYAFALCLFESSFKEHLRNGTSGKHADHADRFVPNLIDRALSCDHVWPFV